MTAHPRLPDPPTRPVAATARAIAVAVLALAAHGPGTSAPQAGAEGRWEGAATLPGQSVPVVLDLLPTGGERWTGRATLPGRGLAGAPLVALSVDAGAVSATLPGPPGSGDGGQVRLSLRATADGALAGDWMQAGWTAPVRLQRSGPAQIAEPPRATWPPALDGTWRGGYDIGFGPRQATLVLADGRATLSVEGRRHVEIPVDAVEVSGRFLLLHAPVADLRIEAPLDGAADGRLAAEWRQGPFVSALPLSRDAKEAK